MISKKKLTPLLLSFIFLLMLGMSFAAVPLYDLFCRVTGFGGTTQISKDIPKIVIDKPVSVRLDTNVQTDLSWNFKTEKNLVDVKPGKVYKVNFVVENFSKDPTSGVASYNVSPSSFGPYFNKLGCFCFEKQTLNPGEKKSYFMTFYLDPEVVNDPKTKSIVITNDLPKTRSGKIMRRLLKDISEERKLGDVTTLANADIVSELQTRSLESDDE